MTTVLITGAGRGIGFALTKQALSLGWQVHGSVRSQGDAFRVAGELGVEPGGLEGAVSPFMPLIFDVTDHDAIAAAASRMTAPLDILINNAGIIGPDRSAGSLDDYEGFAETLAVNTIAPLALTRAFLPHLRKSRSPRVLTISSAMGSLSNTKSDHVAYRASKAAVNKVMQGLATDLAPMGIAVASVHPGWVQTDMGARSADITPEASAAGILALAENLSMKTTGHFFRWDGSSVPW